ncbi:MAG: hypothetical protein ACXWPJ_01020 [Candidatus Limnocylindrales bacterium]
MDAPFQLSDARLQARLLAHVDVEEKIPRALDDLGPVAGRRVLLLDDAADGLRARQLEVLGARLTVSPLDAAELSGLEPGSFEALVCAWAGFSQDGPGIAADLLSTERLLAPGGRLLAIQDYGRDDVAALWADAAREARLEDWSRRDGPLLGAGFRVRVLHCWWTFADLAEAAAILGAAFPLTGAGVVASFRRPRLSYKLAVYHRSTPARQAVA